MATKLTATERNLLMTAIRMMHNDPASRISFSPTHRTGIQKKLALPAMNSLIAKGLATDLRIEKDDRFSAAITDQGKKLFVK